MSPLARSFALLPLGIAIACAAPAFAQQPGADPEVNALVCALGGCDPAAAEAAPSVPAPGAARGGARASDVRGFTFKRVAPDPQGGSTMGAASAPAATASATARTAPAMPAAAHPTSANLRLDFASASAELDGAARARLAKLSTALATPRLAAKRIRIEGHTDASGSATGNRLLSQRRAQAAADYLVAAGIARGRIEVVGYGSAQPLPDIAPTSPANRRVMATVLN